MRGGKKGETETHQAVDGPHDGWLVGEELGEIVFDKGRFGALEGAP